MGTTAARFLWRRQRQRLEVVRVYLLFVVTQGAASAHRRLLVDEVRFPLAPTLHERLRSRIRLAWDTARNGLPDEIWLRVGKELETELAGEEDEWMELFKGLRPLLKEVDEARAELGGDVYPSRRGEQIIESNLTAHELQKPTAQERLHLARRVLARKTVASRARMPARNDFVDLCLLTHLAWPAFLVTL